MMKKRKFHELAHNGFYFKQRRKHCKWAYVSFSFLRLLFKDSACPKCFLVVKLILAFQAETFETFCRKKRNSCLVIFQGGCVCHKYSGGPLQLPPGNNYCHSCFEPCTSVTGGAGVSAIWPILRENRFRNS